MCRRRRRDFCFYLIYLRYPPTKNQLLSPHGLINETLLLWKALDWSLSFNIYL